MLPQIQYTGCGCVHANSLLYRVCKCTCVCVCTCVFWLINYDFSLHAVLTKSCNYESISNACYKRSLKVANELN